MRGLRFPWQGTTPIAQVVPQLKTKRLSKPVSQQQKVSRPPFGWTVTPPPQIIKILKPVKATKPKYYRGFDPIPPFFFNGCEGTYSPGSVTLTPGASSWTCPPAVYSVNIQAWGSGGNGASAPLASGGGGGGGGFSDGNVAVTPCGVYVLGVDGGGNAGATFFTGDDAITITANSGTGAIGYPFNTAGTGGVGNV